MDLLPPEVIAIIAKDSTADDLFYLRRTCKTFYNDLTPIMEKRLHRSRIEKRILLSCDFLTKYFDVLNKNLIAEYQKLSEEFLLTYCTKLSSKFLCRYQRITHRVLTHMVDAKVKIYWVMFCKHQQIEEITYDTYPDRLHWHTIVRHQKLTPEVVTKHEKRFRWYELIASQTLPVEFVRQNANKVNWRDISTGLYNPKGGFMRVLPSWILINFDDLLSWDLICKCVELDDVALSQYHQRIIPNVVIKHQKLSAKYIMSHLDKFSWDDITKYQKFTIEDLREYRDTINWTAISRADWLSYEMYEEFKGLLDREIM